MTEHYILGVDPGLSTFGFALGLLGMAENEPELTILRMGVLRTKKSDRKRHILQTEDNFRRACELSKALREVIAGRKLVAICAESMSFPRSSSVAAKIALSWGILADISVVCDIPMLEAPPQQIKKKICNNLKASKEEIQQALIKKFPGVDFDTLLEKYPHSMHEHPWDALATVVTCLDAEPVRMVRRMLA